MQVVRLDHLRWHLGLKNMLMVDSIGLSGGLVVLWHESINVKLQQCPPPPPGSFDLEVQEDLGGPRWRLTFVYGEPHVENRKYMWGLFKAALQFISSSMGTNG